MSNRGDDEVVWALSEADGKTLWVTRLGPAFRQNRPQSKEGPACTPTVDGERLYVLGMGGDLACLQVRDGKIIWRRSLRRDFGGKFRRGVIASRRWWTATRSSALRAGQIHSGGPG